MSVFLDQALPLPHFTPTSVEEYLALQLAKRLRDETKIERYVRYAERYPASHLAQIFHRTREHSKPSEAFHSLLAPTDP